MIVFATIKKYFIAGVAILAAVLGMLLFREKAAREGDKRKAVQSARDTEQKATKALVDGLANEEKAVEDATARRRDSLNK